MQQALSNFPPLVDVPRTDPWLTNHAPSFQVTPVVVNKALELFMISLCDKASEEARLRNSKRITAGHLKQAILHYEQFDFLADIIQKIADIPAPSAEGSNLTNNGSDSPEDVQSAKKTRRPRQKRAKDDDSF
jgi:hypothetical protein